MKILYNKAQINTAVENIAQEIHKNHFNDPTPPVFICVLNGAFMFFTDLVRAINIDCEIDFIRVKSYNEQQQSEVKLIKDIETDLRGKDVYIIDDILDNGNTMRFLMDHIGRKHKPKSITPIVLFKRYSTNWNITYGIEIKDDSWIFGYGLDGDKGLMRNRTCIFEKSKD